jgi:hypothetical protein
LRRLGCPYITARHGTNRFSLATGHSWLGLASGLMYNLDTTPEASPRPAFERNSSAEQFRPFTPRSQISPGLPSHSQSRHCGTSSRLQTRKTNSRPQAPTAARHPVPSCTVSYSCTMPASSHRLFILPSTSARISMPSTAWRSSVSSSSPSSPTPSSLRFDMLWNLNPCPSCTTESWLPLLRRCSRIVSSRLGF